jgi:hypothetical protein
MHSWHNDECHLKKWLLVMNSMLRASQSAHYHFTIALCNLSRHKQDEPLTPHDQAHYTPYIIDE